MHRQAEHARAGCLQDARLKFKKSGAIFQRIKGGMSDEIKGTFGAETLNTLQLTKPVRIR